MICSVQSLTMLSDFDLIGTIVDDADVPEEEESGSDDEVGERHMGSVLLNADFVSILSH